MSRRLMLLAVPLLVAAAHSGTVAPRTGPEASDFALFAVAALGVWIARKALRARFRHKQGQKQD